MEILETLANGVNWWSLGSLAVGALITWRVTHSYHNAATRELKEESWLLSRITVFLVQAISQGSTVEHHTVPGSPNEEVFVAKLPNGQGLNLAMNTKTREVGLSSISVSDAHPATARQLEFLRSHGVLRESDNVQPEEETKG